VPAERRVALGDPSRKMYGVRLVEEGGRWRARGATPLGRVAEAEGATPEEALAGFLEEDARDAERLAKRYERMAEREGDGDWREMARYFRGLAGRRRELARAVRGGRVAVFLV
jgi:hypothetical protein